MKDGYSSALLVVPIGSVPPEEICTGPHAWAQIAPKKGFFVNPDAGETVEMLMRKESYAVRDHSAFRFAIGCRAKCRTIYQSK